MLSVLLRPRILDDGTCVFAAPLGDGYISFADLSTYGHYTQWIFDNPSKSIGRRISLPTYPTSLKGIAEAFTRVTGKCAVAKDVTQDEWFAAVSAYVDPDVKQPRNNGANEDDDTRFTFRHSFGAWWNIWKVLKLEQEKNRPGLELADEIYPNRTKSVEEWMHVTGYTGEAKAEMKLDEDQAKTF